MRVSYGFRLHNPSWDYLLLPRVFNIGHTIPDDYLIIADILILLDLVGNAVGSRFSK